MSLSELHISPVDPLLVSVISLTLNQERFIFGDMYLDASREISLGISLIPDVA